MFDISAQEFREQNTGRKIVFTNGCFDILHRGHLEYLNEAKKLGDILVVGLNSDNSVRELKGPDRPVNNEKDREFMLLNLRAVDNVWIFNDLTPLKLIIDLKPDVLVKGGDWQIDQIVGAKEVLESGGEVFSLNFVDGYSTTNIIKKIQS